MEIRPGGHRRRWFPPGAGWRPPAWGRRLRIL